MALGTSAIDSGDLRYWYVGRRITRDKKTLKRTKREIRARRKQGRVRGGQYKREDIGENENEKRKREMRSGEVGVSGNQANHETQTATVTSKWRCIFTFDREKKTRANAGK